MSTPSTTSRVLNSIKERFTVTAITALNLILLSKLLL
jgi:hypothetical protein